MTLHLGKDPGPARHILLWKHSDISFRAPSPSTYEYLLLKITSFYSSPSLQKAFLKCVYCSFHATYLLPCFTVKWLLPQQPKGHKFLILQQPDAGLSLRLGSQRTTESRIPTDPHRMSSKRKKHAFIVVGHWNFPG